MEVIIRLIARPVIAVIFYFMLSRDPRTNFTKKQYIFGTGISMVEFCLLHLIVEIHFLFRGSQGIKMFFIEEEGTTVRIVEESVWIVIFIVATILFYRKHIKRPDSKEKWEDFSIWGWSGMALWLMLFLFSILLYCWIKNTDDDIFFMFYDLMIIFVVSFLVSLFLFLKSKKELRRIAETKKKTNRRGKRKRRSRNREDAEKT